MGIIDPLDICPKETRRLLLQKSRLFGDIPSQPIHSPLAAWVHQTPTHGDTSCQLFSTLEIILPFLRERGGVTSLHLYENFYVNFLNATLLPPRNIHDFLEISLIFETNKVISWSCMVCIWLIAIYVFTSGVRSRQLEAGRSLRAFKESARHRNIGLRWKRNQCSHAPWLLVVQNDWRSH